MPVLRTSNFQGATIRPIAPRHKHFIAFIVYTEFCSTRQFKNHIDLFSTFWAVTAKCKL